MISREQALTMEDHVIHESCAMLYAPVTDKLFGQYDVNHTIMVCNDVYGIAYVFVYVAKLPYT